MIRTLGIVMLAAACAAGCAGDDDGPGPADGPQLSVSASAGGTGGVGRIVSTPAGIDCPGDCEQRFEAGTVVELTAEPDASSLFSGWNGSCAGTGVCNLTISQDIAVNAIFSRPILSVELAGDGPGTVTSSVEGIDCGDACSAPFDADADVTLTATAGENAHFVEWTSGCTGSGSCTISPASMPTVTARFDYEHGTTTYTATKEGDPKWEIVGWQVFYGPRGFEAVQQLWNLHSFDGQYGAFEPSTVHAPPYDDEVAERLAELNIDPGDTFTFASWDFPYTLTFAAVIVPSADAPVGSTADYASGPYIPKDLALYSDADLFAGNLGNILVDPDFDSSYPLLTQLQPGVAVDGWSHMTLTYGEDTSFIPGTHGPYKMHVHVYEQGTPGNGWQIDIPFTIVDN